MRTFLDEFEFKTDMAGVLSLLARNLYGDPEIFLRELIQNAHDAVLLRQSREPCAEGRIELEAVLIQRALVVRDNGDGMDEQEIRQFLSVIGASSKPGRQAEVSLLEELNAGGLIGQFGIGFLSAFVVARSIQVTTRKLGSAQGFLWENDASLNCRLSSVEDLPVGTEVRLTLRDEFVWMLDQAFLQDRARRFAEFLPFPIFVGGKGPMNRQFGPWQHGERRSADEREAACQEYILDRFGAAPLDVIPFDIHTPCRAQGVLYMTAEDQPWVDTRGHLAVYVRHMHVNDREESLLPAWAGFIRGVVDSPDLEPTAARDHLQSGDDRTALLRDALGELVLKRLLYLAQNKPARFQAIQAVHGPFLKVMANEDARFFEVAGALLQVRTNVGNLSLCECLHFEFPWETPQEERRRTLYYFTRRGEATQFHALADARSQLVVDASWNVDYLLLAKFVQLHHKTLTLRHIDNCDEQGLYQPLPLEEQAGYHALCGKIQQEVMHHIQGDVRVEVRRLEPEESPAMLVAGRARRLLPRMRAAAKSGHESELARVFLEESFSRQERVSQHLFLNAGHPMVEEVRALLDQAWPGAEALVVQAARTLYGLALLARHDTLDYQERRFVQEHFAECGLAHYHRQEYEEVIAILAPLLDKDVSLEDDDCHFCSAVFTPAYYFETATALYLAAGTQACYPAPALAMAAAVIEQVIETSSYEINKDTHSWFLLTYWTMRHDWPKILSWLPAHRDRMEEEHRVNFRLQALLGVGAWSEARETLAGWLRRNKSSKASDATLRIVEARLLRQAGKHAAALKCLTGEVMALLPRDQLAAIMPFAAAVSAREAKALRFFLSLNRPPRAHLDRHFLWRSLGDAHLAQAVSPGPRRPLQPDSGLAPTLRRPGPAVHKVLRRAMACYRRALAVAVTLEAKLDVRHLVPGVLCRIGMAEAYLSQVELRASRRLTGEAGVALPAPILPRAARSLVQNAA